MENLDFFTFSWGSDLPIICQYKKKYKNFQRWISDITRSSDFTQILKSCTKCNFMLMARITDINFCCWKVSISHRLPPFRISQFVILITLSQISGSKWKIFRWHLSDEPPIVSGWIFYLPNTLLLVWPTVYVAIKSRRQASTYINLMLIFFFA